MPLPTKYYSHNNKLYEIVERNGVLGVEAFNEKTKLFMPSFDLSAFELKMSGYEVPEEEVFNKIK